MINRAILWTTKPPNQPGWYWWRPTFESPKRILQVFIEKRTGRLYTFPDGPYRYYLPFSGEWADLVPKPY